MIEYLHVAGDAECQADHDHIFNKRKHDVNCSLERVGAVQLCHFKDLLVHRSDCRKQDDHVVADVLPHQRNADAAKNQTRLIQPHPRGVGMSCGLKEPVQNSSFVIENHCPDQADIDRGDGAREEAEGSVNSL